MVQVVFHLVQQTVDVKLAVIDPVVTCVLIASLSLLIGAAPPRLCLMYEKNVYILSANQPNSTDLFNYSCILRASNDRTTVIVVRMSSASGLCTLMAHVEVISGCRGALKREWNVLPPASSVATMSLYATASAIWLCARTAASSALNRNVFPVPQR